MALYLETSPGVFTQWRGEPVNQPYLNDAGQWDTHQVQLQASVEQLWTDGELEAVGLFRAKAPDPTPEGYRIVDRKVQRVSTTINGIPASVVKWVETLEPIPTPVITSEMINAYREELIQQGTIVNVPGYGEIPIQGRDEDVRNLAALAQGAAIRLMLQDSTTLTTFRDANNTDHSLTPMQIIYLWQGGANRVSDLYKRSWQIKDDLPIPLDYKNPAFWVLP